MFWPPAYILASPALLRVSTASFGNCTPEVFAELFPCAMGKAQCTVLPIHLGIDDLSRVRIRVVWHA